jgi:hypothetical protein
MSVYEHHVAGFFVKHEEAELARNRILKCGLNPSQIQIYSDDQIESALAHKTSIGPASNELPEDDDVASSFGFGMSAFGKLPVVADNVTLFVASSLITPLALLGWGESLEAVIGNDVDSISQDKLRIQFPDLVSDAILGGQVVLVVATFSEAELRTATSIIQAGVRSIDDESATTIPGDYYEQV